MQKYKCTQCQEDATGGISLVFEGMFFKICKTCAEDKELYQIFLSKMMGEDLDIDEFLTSCTDIPYDFCQNDK